MEEYVLPISPSKRFQNDPVPDSPEKARLRLGTLLSEIRQGDVTPDSLAPSPTKSINDDVSIVNRFQNLAEQKLWREIEESSQDEVTFELRGKQFVLRESEGSLPLYVLCRKWVQPNSRESAVMTRNEPASELGGNNNGFRSLDLLVTKEIHRMPPPRKDRPLLMKPENMPKFQPKEDILSSTARHPSFFLNQYKSHWKNVKKSCMEHNRKKKERYADSLKLLKTINDIAKVVP